MADLINILVYGIYVMFMSMVYYITDSWVGAFAVLINIICVGLVVGVFYLIYLGCKEVYKLF